MLFNQLKVTYNIVNQIINDFVAIKKPHEREQYFEEFKLNYQNVYSMLFPKYLVLNKKYGVENKSKFMLYYKEWVDSKKRSNKATTELAKQPENYKNKPESTLCKFEQQPIEEEKEKKVSPLNQKKESCQPQRT